MRSSLFVAITLCGASPLFAGALGSNPSSVFLNEIYASHVGTDDMEMIELVGTPNASLTGYVVCIVEGEGLQAGILDRAWDLTGQTVPADGYFLLADTAEPNLDFNIGNTNAIENGTETFYVVFTANPAAVTALLGTNVDADLDLITDLGTLGAIVDSVAIIDPDVGSIDFVYDSAVTVGPDGTFFPAGAFRSNDYPNAWCACGYPDFDDVANAREPRTPGSANGGCFGTTGPGCSDSMGRTPNLSSAGTTTPGGSVTITVSDVTPPNAAALFLSAVPGTLPLNPNCNLYMSPPFISVFFTIPAPTFPLTGTIPASLPSGLGLKVYVQLLQDDPPASQIVSSNGVVIVID